MKPTPRGWPRLSSALRYQNAAAMIKFLCDAFGFEVRITVPGDAGEIIHSELSYGEALVMVSSEKTNSGVAGVSPKSVNGANTQSLMMFVDDVDAHAAHARANGATVVDEPADHDYGPEYWTDRSYGVLDPEGHLWWFTERLRG